MLRSLGQNVDRETVQRAAERSRFEQLRQAEQKEQTPAGFSPEFKFNRSGKSGTGRAALSADDLAYYEELKSKYELDLY
jgi:hypothetical protein